MLQQIYPFATQDGKAIPLDIIKSAGLLTKAYTTSVSTFTVPEGKQVGVFLASSACLVRPTTELPGALLDGTTYEDALLIPSDVAVASVVMPGTYYIKGLSVAGTLYLQFIEKWAGLALDKQFQRK